MVIQESPERRARQNRRAHETQFEARRGAIRACVEPGYAYVHVSQIPDEIRADERLCVLRRIAEGFVSVRFPKFTPSGLSFLVADGEVERIERALRLTGDRFSVRPSRSVVSVHAAGIREEAGLIARLTADLFESGARIEHVADDHERLMAVVASSDAERLLGSLGEAALRPENARPRRKRAAVPKVKVMKFGGTSVATAEARQRAADKVAAAVAAGFRPVVMVSAIGRLGLPYATDTLIDQAREASPGHAPDPRDLDLIMACGEILAAVIFAQTLNGRGISAHAFRGDQAGILTDGAFGRARIVAVRPERIERSLREGDIPVVCGFQGCVAPGESERGESGRSGETTTLGRGGSDTTASALGAALGAEAVEIYTDVDGVMSADPRVVPEATPLWVAPYDEIATLAHLGAKVVHPRAAEIAMGYGVPLWVKNTFTEARGTEIVPLERCQGPRRVGVAQIEGLVYLRVDLRSVPDEERPDAEARLYRRLAGEEIGVFMVDLSPTSAGLAVAAKDVAVAMRLLEELDLAASIRTTCSLVSLVGREYVRTPGTLRGALVALGGAGVQPLQTNAADPSIGFLVDAPDTLAAVRALFEFHRSMNDD